MSLLGLNIESSVKPYHHDSDLPTDSVPGISPPSYKSNDSYVTIHDRIYFRSGRKIGVHDDAPVSEDNFHLTHISCATCLKTHEYSETVKPLEFEVLSTSYQSSFGS